MFDLDRFKLVNDTYGHLAGDYVLKHLATVVKQHIRREDVLARYGGEEFAIILPEIDHHNAMQLADKVRRLIERTGFRFEDTDIPLTVSVGVATLGSDTVDWVGFVKLADDNLYAAKAGGRNQVVG